MKQLINEDLSKYRRVTLKSSKPLTEVTRQYNQNLLLFESVKPRISHPEDVIFDAGSVGAKQALTALKDSAKNPKLVSLKWDGSVSVIFGRDANGFVLTDKAGFSKPEGMARTAKQAAAMIYNRKPNQEGRKEYAIEFASLFPILQKVIPANFKGFLQADVMWFKKPNIVNGCYEFTPNKIVYRIPINSELGKSIQKSKFGIAVHSFFSKQGESVPVGVTDLTAFKLINISQLVVFDSKMPSQTTTDLVDDSTETVYKFVNTNAKAIDNFLNKEILRQLQITDLPTVLKSFLSSKAANGQQVDPKLAKECLVWIKSNTKLTEQKKDNITKYILSKKNGFIAIWNVVHSIVAIKNALKHHFDKQTSTTIQALLAGQIGHEGFVIDSPTVKVKLVDRPKFMHVKTDRAFINNQGKK